MWTTIRIIIINKQDERKEDRWKIYEIVKNQQQQQLLLLFIFF